MNLRLLAATLLAANLLFLGWAYLRPEPTTPAAGRAAPVSSDAPRLDLVAELTPEQRKAIERVEADRSGSAPAAPTEVPAIGGSLCVAVGPFDEPAIANRVAEGLRAGGVVIEIREESGQLRTGYWVHLPPFPSREAAEAAAADLLQRGGGELFIVNASEQRHAISLGLFASPERADQRAAEIGELGYRPRIAERFREGAVFWLEYREPAELAVAVTPLLEGLDPAIQRSARTCSTAP